MKEESPEIYHDDISINIFLKNQDREIINLPYSIFYSLESVKFSTGQYFVVVTETNRWNFKTENAKWIISELEKIIKIKNEEKKCLKIN